MRSYREATCANPTDSLPKRILRGINNTRKINGHKFPPHPARQLTPTPYCCMRNPRHRYHHRRIAKNPDANLAEERRKTCATGPRSTESHITHFCRSRGRRAKKRPRQHKQLPRLQGAIGPGYRRVFTLFVVRARLYT